MPFSLKLVGYFLGLLVALVGMWIPLWVDLKDPKKFTICISIVCFLSLVAGGCIMLG